MYRKEIAPMNLCSNNVEWCESSKYLRVYLQSGKYVLLSSILSPPKERFMLHATLFSCIVLELRMI